MGLHDEALAGGDPNLEMQSRQKEIEEKVLSLSKILSPGSPVRFLKNNPKMKKAVIFTFSVFLISRFLFSQKQEFKTTALKIETPPVLDGLLNEAVWQKAPAVTDFIQFEPHKGTAASSKTVVKIIYDNDSIYFGFLCYVPEPNKIQLGTGKRDGLSSTTGTDSATVELDTFNDDRTSYFFRTNPMGVQHDGRAADNGLVADNYWDGIWRSAGAKIKEGWSAEMAIPFKYLKYTPGKNRTWGIQFSRYYPRNLEKSFWVGPLDDLPKGLKQRFTGRA